jgi:hypothetical protein
MAQGENRQELKPEHLPAKGQDLTVAAFLSIVGRRATGYDCPMVPSVTPHLVGNTSHRARCAAIAEPGRR